MAGNISVLDYDPGDMMPPPPLAGRTPEETIENLLEYTRKQSAAFTTLLSQLMNAAQVGFKSFYDGNNTISSNEFGVLTLADAGSSTVTVDPATGTMTFSSSGEENLDGEEMVVEINSAAITLISTTKTQADVTADNETFSQNSDIDALQTTNGPAEAGADVTADNGQGSAWLTTKVEAGAIRVTSGGDAVLLNQMLIDYANDWTDDNPSGLYMTTTKMGFFNTTTNAWPVVFNSDGSAVFEKSVTIGLVDSDNGLQILVDGSGVSSIVDNYNLTSYYSTVVQTGGEIIFYGKVGSAPSLVASEVEVQMGRGDFASQNFRAGFEGGISGTGPVINIAAGGTGNFGQETNSKLAITTAGDADDCKLDIDPGTLVFGVGKSYAGKYYDSGWILNQALNTGFSSAHGLAARPNFFKLLVRENGTTDTIQEAMVEPGSSRGVHIYSVDATNINLAVDGAGVIAWSGSNFSWVTSGTVDVRIFAWI